METVFVNIYLSFKNLSVDKSSKFKSVMSYNFTASKLVENGNKLEFQFTTKFL